MTAVSALLQEVGLWGMALALAIVALDQRHLRLHRRRDVGTDQPGGTGTDHDQVAIEALRLRPRPVDLMRLPGIERAAGSRDLGVGRAPRGRLGLCLRLLRVPARRLDRLDLA